MSLPIVEIQMSALGGGHGRLSLIVATEANVLTEHRQAVYRCSRFP